MLNVTSNTYKGVTKLNRINRSKHIRSVYQSIEGRGPRKKLISKPINTQYSNQSVRLIFFQQIDDCVIHYVLNNKKLQEISERYPILFVYSGGKHKNEIQKLYDKVHILDCPTNNHQDKAIIGFKWLRDNPNYDALIRTCVDSVIINVDSLVNITCNLLNKYSAFVSGIEKLNKPVNLKWVRGGCQIISKRLIDDFKPADPKFIPDHFRNSNDVWFYKSIQKNPKLVFIPNQLFECETSCSYKYPVWHPNQTSNESEKYKEFYRINTYKKDILLWINTYNRPEMLDNLLHDIQLNQSNNTIDIYIFDDYSTCDYTNIISKYSCVLNIKYTKMTKRYGKHSYWELFSYAMSCFKKVQNEYKYFVKLDDDLRLTNNFFDKCINIWNDINDDKKICLNFRLDDRENKPCWTGFQPILTQTKTNMKIYKTQWVDCDFFCTVSFFRALNFMIPPIHKSRWVKNPNASSGVGRIMSIILSKCGSLYQTFESLVLHDHHISYMNKLERETNLLITIKFSIDSTYGVVHE